MNKISVIIPVYNREKYIGKCLDSVLDQTYQNIEIICVDDHSADGSLSVCREYEKKDNRVKVVALQENGGVSHARNTGMSLSTGEWIAFVDSDDVIDKEMLGDMIRAAEKYGVDAVLSDLEMFSQGKQQDMTISIEPNRVFTKHDIRGILPRFTYNGNDNLGLFAFSTKLYRKSIIKEKNICFDSSIAYEEDKLFVIEYLANCNSLIYIPKAYYKYDTSSVGLYSAFHEKAWLWYVNAYMKFHQLIEDYAIENTDPKYLADSFLYNITWFLYRSRRIQDKKKRKELQRLVIGDERVQKICADNLNVYTSFDRRMANAVLSRNRWRAISMIDFVYSGKKDQLLKLLRRR